MSSITTVIVALIGSPVLIWWLSRFDRRNSSQHENNMEILNEVKNDVKDIKADVWVVRNDLYDHVAHHAHKESNDGSQGRTATTEH